MWESLNDIEVRAAAVALGCNVQAVTTKDDALSALGEAGIDQDQAKAALVRMANSLSALQPNFMMSAAVGAAGVSDAGPKRNVSAYCHFVQRNRDRIQQAGEPGEKFMTRAVRLWNQQSTEERAQYEAMANEDKVRYKRERRQHKIALRKQEISEGEGSAKRRKKHPDAPKRAVPAYMLYANAERENVKAERPDLTHREILTELGVRWRNLDTAAKAPYESLAAEERVRYQTEIAKWREENPEPKEDKALERRRRRKKEEGAPKRAQTAFLYFANDVRQAVREEMPEKSHKEVLAFLGERWKAMPEEEKRPYLASAEADRARYHAEMVEWRANNPKPPPASSASMASSSGFLPGTGAANMLLAGMGSANPAMAQMAMALMGTPVLQPRKRGRKKKEPGAPKKCSTAFLFFANQQRPILRESQPELKHGDILKALGEEWRNMSEVQKEPFEKAAREDRNRYDREMEAWRAEKAAEAASSASAAAHGPAAALGFGPMVDPTSAAAAAAALANSGLAGLGLPYMTGSPSSTLADLTSTIAGSLTSSASASAAPSFTVPPFANDESV